MLQVFSLLVEWKAGAWYTMLSTIMVRLKPTKILQSLFLLLRKASLCLKKYRDRKRYPKWIASLS